MKIQKIDFGRAEGSFGFVVNDTAVIYCNEENSRDFMFQANCRKLEHNFMM